ncbi:MAG: hypothetical protein JNL57_08380 [Bacteroidetes bacterium]|nr:hypothetical protein [Bacteroidota bacterium]
MSVILISSLPVLGFSQLKLASTGSDLDSVHMTRALAHFSPSNYPFGPKCHMFEIGVNKNGDSLLWMNSWVSSKKFAAQAMFSLKDIPVKDTAVFRWNSPYLGFVQYYNATLYMVDTLDKLKAKGKAMPEVRFAYKTPADPVSWLSGPHIQMLKNGKFMYNGQILGVGELIGKLKQEKQSNITLLVNNSETAKKLKPVKEKFKKAGINLMIQLKSDINTVNNKIKLKEEERKQKKATGSTDSEPKPEPKP